jgi:hypothetical protein
MHERTDVCKTIVMTKNAAGILALVLVFEHSQPLAIDAPSAAWLASMVTALGNGVAAITWGRPIRCMVRVDHRGEVAEIGSIVGRDWFAVKEPVVVTRREQPVDRARRYLNKRRALIGMKDIVGFSDHDIIADATHYGWRDET